jgi:hypothetical protein
MYLTCCYRHYAVWYGVLGCDRGQLLCGAGPLPLGSLWRQALGGGVPRRTGLAPAIRPDPAKGGYRHADGAGWGRSTELWLHLPYPRIQGASSLSPCEWLCPRWLSSELRSDDTTFVWSFMQEIMSVSLRASSLQATKIRSSPPIKAQSVCPPIASCTKRCLCYLLHLAY